MQIHWKGFTLIELLVAIAIVGVLAAATIAALNPVAQRQKANDAQRKSDLAQVQRALEIYYQDFGQYPQSNGAHQIVTPGPPAATHVWGSAWMPYISKLPKDPGHQYVYFSPDGQHYYLYASLDRKGSDPQACTGAGNVCPNALANGLSNACSGTCNYGVSSSNTSP